MFSAFWEAVILWWSVAVKFCAVPSVLQPALPALVWQPPENGCELVSPCCGLRVEAEKAITIEKNLERESCSHFLWLHCIMVLLGLVGAETGLSAASTMNLSLYYYWISSKWWLFKGALDVYFLRFVAPKSGTAKFIRASIRNSDYSQGSLVNCGLNQERAKISAGFVCSLDFNSVVLKRNRTCLWTPQSVLLKPTWRLP